MDVWYIRQCSTMYWKGDCPRWRLRKMNIGSQRNTLEFWGIIIITITTIKSQNGGNRMCGSCVPHEGWAPEKKRIVKAIGSQFIPYSVKCANIYISIVLFKIKNDGQDLGFRPWWPPQAENNWIKILPTWLKLPKCNLIRTMYYTIALAQL